LRLICGSGPVVIAFLLQRTLARRRWTFADLDLPVVNKSQHLAEAAHVDPAAARLNR